MKTIICGGRELHDPWMLDKAIKACPWQITEVISGGARGIDRLGEIWGMFNHLPVYVFAADWKVHGKAAGPKRNEQMAGVAEAVLAVWDGRSKGTKDMIDRGYRHHLRVYIHLVS